MVGSVDEHSTESSQPCRKGLICARVSALEEANGECQMTYEDSDWNEEDPESTRAARMLKGAQRKYLALIGLEIFLGLGDLLLFFFQPSGILVATVAWALLLYAVIPYGMRLEMTPWQIVLAIALHLLLWVPGVLYMLHYAKAYENTTQNST